MPIFKLQARLNLSSVFYLSSLAHPLQGKSAACSMFHVSLGGFASLRFIHYCRSLTLCLELLSVVLTSATACRLSGLWLCNKSRSIATLGTPSGHQANHKCLFSSRHFMPSGHVTNTCFFASVTPFTAQTRRRRMQSRPSHSFLTPPHPRCTQLPF